MRKFHLALALIFAISCEETPVLVPIGIGILSGGASGAGGAVVAIEAQKKECNERSTRDAICECWTSHLSLLATPKKCWKDSGGNYIEK